MNATCATPRRAAELGHSGAGQVFYVVLAPGRRPRSRPLQAAAPARLPAAPVAPPPRPRRAAPPAPPAHLPPARWQPAGLLAGWAAGCGGPAWVTGGYLLTRATQVSLHTAHTQPGTRYYSASPQLPPANKELAVAAAAGVGLRLPTVVPGPDGPRGPDAAYQVELQVRLAGHLPQLAQLSRLHHVAQLQLRAHRFTSSTGTQPPTHTRIQRARSRCPQRPVSCAKDTGAHRERR